MKKLFFAFLSAILLINLIVSPIIAATPVPTKKTAQIQATTAPSATSSSTQNIVGEKLNKQINQLKDRIASRVAELNLVEKRGIIGNVTDSSGNQVTFTDMTGKTRFLDVDEITKFSSPSAKSSFGLSDLVKGTKISVLGLYNKQSQRILARFIDSLITPTYLSGRIAELDSKNFTITVISDNKKQTKVDIQTITNISSYTKDDGVTKFGFSKLNIGDRVMVTGFPDKIDPALLVASRILDLAELPTNPKIIIPEPTITEDLSPSPNITKKITPTKPAIE